MATATPFKTRASGDVTQTAYELSERITYKRWTGKKYQTRYIVVSHTRYNGSTETAVFPSARNGEVTAYTDLFMASPACDDETALSALGFTLIDPLSE